MVSTVSKIKLHFSALVWKEFVWRSTADPLAHILHLDHIHNVFVLLSFRI